MGYQACAGDMMLQAKALCSHGFGLLLAEINYWRKDT